LTRIERHEGRRKQGAKDSTIQINRKFAKLISASLPYHSHFYALLLAKHRDKKF